MDIFNFNPEDMLSFFLTLFRVSIVLFLIPFFGGRSVPTMVKAALTIVLALALWPHLSFPAALFPASPWNIALMILGEIVLGLMLGISVLILFSAVQTGGQIIGFQMGFSMVSVVDPITGVSNAVSAHFLYMCTMLVFLTLNGHLYLLQTMGESFALIPPGGLILNSQISATIFEFSKNIFVLSIKIAAPCMVALFLVDLSLALVSKAAPQMNVLILGFPVKIAVGFFFMGFLFTILSDYVSDFIKEIVPFAIHLMQMASPG